MLLPSVLPSGSALVFIWHKLYPHDVRHCASQSQSYWWVSRNISFLGLIQTKQPSQQFRTSKRIIFSRSVSVCLKAVHFGSVNNKIDYVCLVSASLPLFILNRDMGPQLKKPRIERTIHSCCRPWRRVRPGELQVAQGPEDAEGGGEAQVRGPGRHCPGLLRGRGQARPGLHQGPALLLARRGVCSWDEILQGSIRTSVIQFQFSEHTAS